MRRGLMRQLTAVAAGAVVLLAGGGCGMLSGSSGRQIIYIGVDLPLSGPREAAGAVHHNALRLRVEQVNTGQLAGGRFRLGLRVLDNGSDAATAAGNLATLAGDPQVAAVVAAGCPSCVSDVEPGVPLISLDAVDVLAEVDQPEQRRWLFRLGPNAADDADRLSQAMAQAGVQYAAVVSVDDPYGRAGASWVRDAADRDNITIAVDEQVGSDGGGVQAAAEAVAGWRPQQVVDPVTGQVQNPVAGQGQPAGPDAVVIWAQAPLAGTVAAGLRREGFDGPLFVDMAAAGDLFLSGDQAALDGATLVATDTLVIDQMITASPAAAARADWFESYLSRFDTYHPHASWAADAVNVLVAAVTRGDSTEPAVVRDQLESIRIDGFTGAIRFTASQHSGLHPGSLLLLTATGGRWYPQPG